MHKLESWKGTWDLEYPWRMVEDIQNLHFPAYKLKNEC